MDSSLSPISITFSPTITVSWRCCHGRSVSFLQRRILGLPKPASARILIRPCIRAVGTLAETLLHHNNIDALVWLDTSAEQHALYLQAFELAKLRVTEAMKGRDPGTLCVFTDCDETLLDNSEFNSWLVLTGRNFTESAWDEYCRDKRSRVCAGAVEFTQWIRSNGVQLFYVTSRSNATRSETAENMSALGFPIEPSDFTEEIRSTHLFMKYMKNPADPTKPWEKWPQYDWIEKNRGVTPLLWLGDNLSDFREGYKKDPWRKRLESAGSVDAPNWGTRFIVMPNPVYGDWLRRYIDEKSGQSLVDDEGSPESLNVPVRPPLPPFRAPKLRHLEIWPRMM